MQTVLLILQAITAIILVLLILAQNRGTGLSGAAFGNLGGGFYATKRGAEKILANATVIAAVAFIVLSFAASLV